MIPGAPDPCEECGKALCSDFYRCEKAMNAKGSDLHVCQRYKKVYSSLCPSFWVDNWDELRGKWHFSRQNLMVFCLPVAPPTEDVALLSPFCVCI
ncbi:hypothetical protein Chor_005376 [Crotalus horridus]